MLLQTDLMLTAKLFCSTTEHEQCDRISESDDITHRPWYNATKTRSLDNSQNTKYPSF